MNVTLTAWQDSTSCGWCEKTRPCVTTSFDDGFLKNVDLCFGCLQQTLKVRSRQEATSNDAKPDRTRPRWKKVGRRWTRSVPFDMPGPLFDLCVILLCLLTGLATLIV